MSEPADTLRTYHAALTRLLKWARDHAYGSWSEAGDCDVYAYGPAEELINALAEAGFEVEHDGTLSTPETREERRDG